MRVVSTLVYGNDLLGIKQLGPDDVLHIYDTFTSERLSQYLALGTPKYIVNDHMTYVDLGPDIKCHCVPLWLDAEMKKFNSYVMPDTVDTKHIFNFMVNKVQINRFLCLNLVQWFNLQDFDYTWSAVKKQFNTDPVIAEMDALGERSPLPWEVRGQILGAIQIPKKFFYAENSRDVNESYVENYGSNQWTWENGLSTIFSNSAVSLITESIEYQKATTFTEKTLYSVMGLTFPIWVGGFGQASEWRRLGFDVFDDVIDHSYQYYDTLIERCYYAFTKNLELLTNKQKVSELRIKHLARLQNNCQLLTNNHLEAFNKQEISTWPADLQQAMPTVANFFRIYS